MNVIAPRTLREFWQEHPQAEIPLREWLKKVQKNLYPDFNSIRAAFPSADYVKLKDGSGVIVFDIGDNRFRLVVFVNYEGQRMYVGWVMTHSEYDFWNKLR